jgi:hypothetical protein
MHAEQARRESPGPFSLAFSIRAALPHGTGFDLQRFSCRKANEFGRPAMSLFIYIALFVAACGFGWWAKGADKGP